MSAQVPKIQDLIETAPVKTDKVVSKTSTGVRLLFKELFQSLPLAPIHQHFTVQVESLAHACALPMETSTALEIPGTATGVGRSMAEPSPNCVFAFHHQHFTVPSDIATQDEYPPEERLTGVGSEVVWEDVDEGDEPSTIAPVEDLSESESMRPAVDPSVAE